MNKLLLTLLLVTALTGSIAYGQSGSDQVRAVEHARLRSLVDADMKTADLLHADDFQLISPLGGKLSKEEYLGAISSGNVDYLLWEPDTIEVRLYGDVAVLRYKAQIQIKVKSAPDAPQGQFWHTDLYEKVNGQWKVIWSQATQIR